MKKFIILLISLPILLVSCKEAAFVATVGDIKITEGEFRGYLSSVKTQMMDTELQTDEDWEINEIEGKKAIDVAKETALDSAIQNALCIETAKRAGIELDNSDKKEIEQTKNQIVASYGGEDGYKKYLKENGVSDEFFDRMCQANVYRVKIARTLMSKAPSEAEQKKYFEEHVEEFSEYRKKAKHILFLTEDPQTRQPKSEEEKIKAKELFENVLKRAQAGENFDALMNEYSEDPGLATAPSGYVFGAGEMVPEFEQAVFSAKEGEITSCVSSYGYHIIKRLPLEFSDVSNYVISSLILEMADEKIEQWKNEYSIKVEKNEDVLKEIK